MTLLDQSGNNRCITQRSVPRAPTPPSSDLAYVAGGGVGGGGGGGGGCGDDDCRGFSGVGDDDGSFTVVCGVIVHLTSRPLRRLNDASVTFCGAM